MRLGLIPPDRAVARRRGGTGWLGGWGARQVAGDDPLDVSLRSAADGGCLRFRCARFGGVYGARGSRDEAGDGDHAPGPKHSFQAKRNGPSESVRRAVTRVGERERALHNRERFYLASLQEWTYSVPSGV